jgi:hypothetical protein
MSNSRSRSVRFGVVSAVSLVVVLAGMLVAVVLRHSPRAAYVMPAPPPATVPAPRPCTISELAIPTWGSPWAQGWPLRFVTDLDMLAPLGTGTANAAQWFAAFTRPLVTDLDMLAPPGRGTANAAWWSAVFARPHGPRLPEAEAARGRLVDHAPLAIAPNGVKVLPPSDPLLAEAAPWCDQATMRFYPDVFAVQGGDTQFPNIIFMMDLARSWIARGHDAASFEDAMADFRRVIRLGRLLRQDDVVLIDDLLGLSCIGWGAEAIFERAIKEGKTDLALLAAVVAGEAPPQRWLSAARVTALKVAPYLHKDATGAYVLELPAERFKAIREMAMSCPERRFRNGAIFNLRYVAALASGPIRGQAREVLQMLASAGDPIVAANARWSLATPVSDKDVQGLLGQSQ